MCLLGQFTSKCSTRAQFWALQGVPLPATNGDSGGNSSSLRLTSWPLRLLRGQLACQWTRPSGHNWDPFVPGLPLTRTTGQSAQTSKEQETLLTSLPFPLSFLYLTFLSFPVFLVPQSWMQESSRRALAWAEDWRLITSSWQRTRILVLVWSDFW